MGQHDAVHSNTNRRPITAVQVVLLVIAAIALIWVAAKFIGYSQGQQIYRSMQSAYAQDGGIDFSALARDYPGAVAWIRMDDLETIDYPVMQGTDNDFYLHNDPKGNSSVDGSIFLDYRNNAVNTDMHSIVYGHNMRDGSMFGTLKSYTDQDFYQKGSGKFTVFTPTGSYRYQIFAINIVDPTDDTFLVGFNDAKTFGSFVDQLKADSMYDTGVGVTGYDQIVTLSTCSSSDRLVVSAKRVRE